VNTPGTNDEIIAVFLAINVLQSQIGRTGTRTLDCFHTSLSMSIGGSRESDGWEMKVLGPNGVEGSYTSAGSAGEREGPVCIGDRAL